MTYTEAQNKATQKYKSKHYRRIPLDVTKDKYEEISNHATAHGESVNGFIKRAIDETIDRDTHSAVTAPVTETPHNAQN